MTSKRLIELIKQNKIQMAKILARGIRQNDEIINIHEKEDYVKIEFENFIGVHKIKRLNNGEKIINTKGKYKLKSDEVKFEIDCNIKKDILKEIYDEINDKEENNKSNISNKINQNKKEINRNNNDNMNLLTRFLSIF